MRAESVQEIFSENAGSLGDKTAIEWRDERVTYSELEAGANRLANYLISANVAKGSIIALVIQDRVKLVEAIIGILKAGCVFACLDPRDPGKRLESMIQEINPDLFIIEQAFYERLSSLTTHSDERARAIIVDRGGESGDRSGNIVVLDGYLSYENSEKPFIPAAPDDMCYIYFTSGSTGTPKAIAGRVKSLLHFIKWEMETLGVDRQYRTSQLAVPTFDAYLRDVFLPLCAGATACIPDSVDTILDTRKLIRWIDDRKINLIHCVPSIFRALVNEELRPDEFASLKHIIMAGEQLFPSEIKKWMDVYGERVQLVNLYGATENTMAKFCYFITEQDTRRKTIPVGKPIPGAKAIILDPDLNICDPGVVGEIYIRTPYLTLGYYNHPELTKEVFVPNPFGSDPHEVIYKTGDLARILPDGNFELLGRKDHQVKVRGFRVELGEIEAALKRHPGVNQAVVVVKGKEPDDTRLVAYVVAGSDGPPPVNELIRFLYDHLPEYMVPSAFVTLEALPLLPNGKIDRNALPEPEQSRPDLEEAFVAPRTPVEQAVADICSQVLRVGRVGVNDNFFLLGGHSLLATQVMARVRETFNVEVPLRRLFERPTIAGLAAAIEELETEQRQSEESRILEMVEQLSESEVEAMLEQISES